MCIAAALCTPFLLLWSGAHKVASVPLSRENPGVTPGGGGPFLLLWRLPRNGVHKVSTAHDSSTTRMEPGGSHASPHGECPGRCPSCSTLVTALCAPLGWSRCLRCYNFLGVGWCLDRVSGPLTLLLLLFFFKQLP